MKELDWVNPDKRFDLCKASTLQSASVCADERQEGDFKTSVFAQSLQLHVRKVILTTGTCYICTLSLHHSLLPSLHVPVVQLCKNIKRNKKKNKTTNSAPKFTLTSPRLLWKKLSSSGSADMINYNIT